MNNNYKFTQQQKIYVNNIQHKLEELTKENMELKCNLYNKSYEYKNLSEQLNKCKQYSLKASKERELNKNNISDNNDNIALILAQIADIKQMIQRVSYEI